MQDEILKSYKGKYARRPDMYRCVYVCMSVCVYVCVCVSGGGIASLVRLIRVKEPWLYFVIRTQFLEYLVASGSILVGFSHVYSISYKSD